jgi:hypothetical protein
MIRTLLLFSLLGISACSADITQYRANTPVLDHMQFFSGKLCAWGTVHDYTGQVTRRFIADIDGTATESSFELDEVFLFDDGTKQTRLWKFTKTAEGWDGTAGDVVGVAKGKFIGNMMHLEYDLDIPMDDDSIVISMDDELHLIDENNMLGKTIMTKFGITVGEINLLMQKQQQESRCELEVE